MPPKLARGRKKIIADAAENGKELEIKSNDRDLNHNNVNVKDGNKPIKKKANNDANTDLPVEGKNSDEHDNGETVEEEVKNSGNSSDANQLASDKLKENKTIEELPNTNIESQTKVPVKNSNLKVAPPKRGRKKDNAPAESDVQTETNNLVSLVDKDIKESLPKERSKDTVSESPKSVSSGENISEVAKDDHKSEHDSGVDEFDGENKPEMNKAPLKRLRPKRAVDKTSDEQHQTEEKAPSKRGRKKATIPMKTDVKKIVDSKKISDKPLQSEKNVRGRRKANNLKSDEDFDLKEEICEEPSEKTVEQVQAEEKVPAKRGRNKANIPPKSESSKLKTVEKEISEKDSPSNVKEPKNDVNIPSVEIKMQSKRGRKKANQKEAEKDLNNKPSQDSDEKLEGEAEMVADNKNEKLKRLKRKNETSAEEVIKDDFNEAKVLKVALQRNVNIDKMVEGNVKIIEHGKDKNTKAGNKRTKKDDADSKESGEKSSKIPKGESKGQSKKDKMPDVTLLDFSNNSTSPSGKPWNLKISSWNVNGIRAWLEKDGLAYIAHENPDIVTFQETKCSDKMLPKEVNITGYHSYWLAGDKDGYSGVGLLSKKEPVSVNYGIGVEEHDEEGRVITAEYETFYLVTAYIPNAGRGLVRLDYRMQWDKDFRNYLKRLDEKKPVILCGDLNVAHEEIDLANPKTNKKNAGFTKEEREGFSTLLSEGFVDSFRQLYPDVKSAYTFWTYMMNARAKNVGWRLDYFVLSKKLIDHLCDNVIRKDVFGSDHCPITLFLHV